MEIVRKQRPWRQSARPKAWLGLGVLIGTLALMIGVAWASSYYSYFEFDTTLRGETRYYSADDLHMSCTTREKSGHNRNISTFTVKLYHDDILDDFCGARTYPRVGYAQKNWSDVAWPNSNYYFHFSKAFDGVVLRSDNVHMWSN
jgi:hypothetical protein